MITAKMIEVLGLRMKNPAANIFTNAMKLRALNNAQMKAANNLRVELLTELEYIKTPVTLTAGVVALTSANLGYTLLRGAEGIKKVVITGGKECTRIEYSGKADLQNTLKAATLSNPYCYVFKNQLYVLPITAATADIWYLRVPPTLRYTFAYTVDVTNPNSEIIITPGNGTEVTADYYNGAVIRTSEDDAYHVITDYIVTTGRALISPAKATGNYAGGTIHFITNDFETDGYTGTQPLLNEAYHNIILDFAESECWQIGRDLKRFADMYKKAMADIKELNESYVPPKGIGTEGNRAA
jgi:hypothetical protein